MSCNHLDNCSRCAELVYGADQTDVASSILSAIRQEARLQLCNGTDISLLIGEALSRIADNIEEQL